MPPTLRNGPVARFTIIPTAPSSASNRTLCSPSVFLKKSGPFTPPSFSTKRLLPHPPGRKPDSSTSQATAQAASASTYLNPINCLAATSFSKMLSAVGIFRVEVTIFYSAEFVKKFSPFPKKPLFIRATDPPPPSVAKKLRILFFNSPRCPRLAFPNRNFIPTFPGSKFSTSPTKPGLPPC